MARKRQNNEETEEIEQIKQDLLEQLLEQGKIGKHFESLVDDRGYIDAN